jgi:hypothetical protein
MRNNLRSRELIITPVLRAAHRAESGNANPLEGVAMVARLNPPVNVFAWPIMGERGTQGAMLGMEGRRVNGDGAAMDAGNGKPGDF